MNYRGSIYEEDWGTAWIFKNKSPVFQLLNDLIDLKLIGAALPAGLVSGWGYPGSELSPLVRRQTDLAQGPLRRFARPPSRLQCCRSICSWLQ